MTAFKIGAKILTVAPWGGNKRRLAPRIVELLGDHDDFREPFTGGCAILPRKKPSRWETVNDANPSLVNVLKAMRDHPRSIASDLGAMLFTKNRFEIATDAIKSGEFSGPGPDLAAHQLAVWWMGANGYAGTTTKQWFAQRFTKTGGDPSVRWESFKQSVPDLSDRLKGVEISCSDFRDVVDPIIDRRGLAIYADPPYLTKKIKYVHDFTMQDHIDLAALLNGFTRARIVVSYYDAPELATLYPADRWERHEVSISKSSANARSGATKTAATELLLVNRI